jgi:hypothetical protein
MAHGCLIASSFAALDGLSLIASHVADLPSLVFGLIIATLRHDQVAIV